jgi:hypothetical protein
MARRCPRGALTSQGRRAKPGRPSAVSMRPGAAPCGRPCVERLSILIRLPPIWRKATGFGFWARVPAGYCSDGSFLSSARLGMQLGTRDGLAPEATRLPGRPIGTALYSRPEAELNEFSLRGFSVRFRRCPGQEGPRTIPHMGSREAGFPLPFRRQASWILVLRPDSTPLARPGCCNLVVSHLEANSPRGY